MAKKAKSKDEIEETLRHIFRESGVEPKDNVILRLLRYWVESTAQAQARGIKIKQMVDKEGK